MAQWEPAISLETQHVIAPPLPPPVGRSLPDCLTGRIDEWG